MRSSNAAEEMVNADNSLIAHGTHGQLVAPHYLRDITSELFKMTNSCSSVKTFKYPESTLRT